VDEILTPRQFITLLASLGNKTVIAYNTALLRMMPKAELRAKQNVKRNFPGRNNRRLTGGLLNSISHGFKLKTNDFGEAFLVSKGIPYNAIHEFGGDIKPVKANNLWIKNHDVKQKYKSLTPREYMGKMLSQGAGDPERFAILRAKSSRKLTAFAFMQGRAEALFFLRKEVSIPARPYMQPAIDDTADEFDTTMSAIFDSEVDK